MAADERSAQPPPLRNLLSEFAAVPKLLAGPLRTPVKLAGAGRGRPIMVIPGMMSGDSSTIYLRRSLAASGFAVHDSAIRFHTGIEAERFAFLAHRVQQLHSDSMQQPILLGWSLGGIYARALALKLPSEVGLVMSLGSPFSGPRTANRAWRLYNLVNDHSVNDPPIEVDISRKPQAYTIAAWSPDDGVVSVASARGLANEVDDRLQLSGSHIDLGSSTDCVRAIIARLAIAG